MRTMSRRQMTRFATQGRRLSSAHKSGTGRHLRQQAEQREFRVGHRVSLKDAG